MSDTKMVHLLYGRGGMTLRVPNSALVPEGKSPEPLCDPRAAIAAALAAPIGCSPLAELLAQRRPRTVAVTISDITRPVPNREFLPALLEVINRAGIPDRQIVIIVGTGMHRASTPDEHKALVGPEVLERVDVVDHRAEDQATLVKVSDTPPVYVCRRFADADFHIVTGYIEPHFMAGFSGGRKGVCPALVDLRTVQRFHGYETLANPKAENGVLDGNPCHEIALAVARAARVDFLLNVAITRDRRTAAVFCGDLEAAHLAGCRQVAQWTTARIDGTFDLVVTNGGGYPLDQVFYQAVKGMCTAMPALAPHSTLLQVSHCGEGLGSKAFADLVIEYGHDWRRFLRDIAARRDETRLDQWEFQMRARVLARIGRERLCFVSDGLAPDVQRRLALNPVLGPGAAQDRAQRFIDEFLAARPNARVAIVPDGPYTMLQGA